MMQRKTILLLGLVGCALGASLPSAHIGIRNHPRLLGTGTRVVGGSNATPGQFPYQVSLQWVTPNDRYHNCGGSILSETWIVTAGHCSVDLASNGHYVVVAGEQDLETNEGHEQEVLVSKIIVHESYGNQPIVKPFDIALMKLASSLTFNQWVSAIALPTSGSIPLGDATLSGWGSISTGFFPEYPTTLQTAVLPVLEYNVCKAQYPSSPLAESNVCTGPLSGGKGACSGDSGGPLALNGQLIGVVSWGQIPCGSRNAPSVFTRVSAYVDWINTNMKA